MDELFRKSLKLENQFKFTWVMIVISPIIVSVLVSINIFDIPISNDWIGFYASLLGGTISGLLTYFSMYMSMSAVRKQISEQKRSNELLELQLNNEKLKSEESQRLNVRPYINEYVGCSNHVIEYSAIILENCCYENELEDKFNVKIKNIGLGPVIELKIESLNGNPTVNDEIKSLEKDGVMNLEITYTFNEMYNMNTYELQISYCDILDNKYLQAITIHSFRNNDGKHMKSVITKISKPKLIKKISL